MKYVFNESLAQTKPIQNGASKRSTRDENHLVQTWEIELFLMELSFNFLLGYSICFKFLNNDNNKFFLQHTSLMSSCFGQVKFQKTIKYSFHNSLEWTTLLFVNVGRMGIENEE